MNEFSKKDNYNKNKTLSLMQVFGLILFIFSAIVFLCLISVGKIFLVISEEIFIFLLGTLGYSSYAFFAAFVYAGLAMFFGKKPSVKRKKVIQAILLFVVIGLILQLATSGSVLTPIPGYGQYLSGVYKKGLEGITGATFGGVIFGIVLYPFFRLLTPIVSYVLFSIIALVLIFFLFNINYYIKGKKPDEYFDKPDLKIKGYKEYNLNLPAETAAAESREKVETAPRKLFVANISEFSQKKKPAGKNSKAYDLLIGGPKPQSDSTATALAYSSTPNSSEILFKKPDVSKSMGKELFSSSDSYVESFDKSLAEKKKYILTPPDPNLDYVQDLGLIKRKRSDDDKNMPKYIHDKIDDKNKKKKYNVLENQMTAYDLYKENSEFDDVDFEYEEINKIKEKPDNKYDEKSIIKSKEDYTSYSSKNIFDPAKKYNLLKKDQSEIISDSYKPESIENINNYRPENVNNKKDIFNKPDIDSFFNKVDSETEDDVEKPEYIEYSPYNAPPLDLLREPKFDSDSGVDDYDEKAALLEQTLEDFKIYAKVINITPGSSVTRYELQMPPGMPVSRILSRSDDIAMALSSVGDVRIEAPIPGKNLLGIEIPNSKRKLVVIKEVLNTKEFFEARSKLSFALGKDISGKNYIVDIAKMPHLLIAGATGSGKSVCLNTILISILCKASPEDVRIILIDPKRVEFNIYADLPHLLIKNIINDQEKALSALNWAIVEMERRFALFKKCNAKDIDSYNERIDKSVENKLPRILIVVDELAELMSSKKAGEVEEKIQRLSQLSRAAGIHLVLATQRPSVDVITGLIKANMPSRIAFRVISQIDSRTIMDVSGAEKLLGDGDMIFISSNTPKPIRMQCPYISMEEIEDVLDYIKNNNDAYFDDKISDNILTSKQSGASGAGNYNNDENDPYLFDVLKLAIESNQISISMVQRRFAVGYARAGKIIDDLERQGLISALDGSKPRQVLITMDEFKKRFGDR